MPRKYRKIEDKSDYDISEMAATLLQKLVRLEACCELGYCRCVTCGANKHWNEMQGGHYIKRQHKRSKLMKKNIHPQCIRCNHFLDGNEGKYTLYMLSKYGEEFVNELIEKKKDPIKWDKEELIKLVKDLRIEVKELERQIC